jgi:hypothetical protein
MHGLIFTELHRYVTKNYGVNQWLTLLESVQLKGKIYLPTQVYPDQEAMNIVAKASEVTNTPPAKILESFGEFIAPTLLSTFRASINPEWTTLDLLQYTEDKIHNVVRHADKTATPPQLTCRRLTPNVVVIDYSSQRKIPEVGIGIIKAIAKIKRENVDIVRTDVNGVTTLRVALRASKPVPSL